MVNRRSVHGVPDVDGSRHTVLVSDELGVRNEVGGAVTGAVVQAGSIQHVTVLGVALTGQSPPPRQLPPRIRDFVGRVEQMATLDALLPAAYDESVAGAVVISAVDGLAGVGKTALAVSWAHRVQDRFPDGTLYVNLHGYGPGEPVTPGEVLRRFLQELGVMPERIPIELEARVGLYRSVSADRRMLIVLDNASAAEQVRPLLPASRGCLVLVTSRDSLTGLVISEGAVRVTLDPLAPKDAVALLDGMVGRQRTVAEPDSVRELAQVCDRLPLALRIAGGRIASRTHLRIADVLAEMGDGCGRLDALSTSMDEATSVRAVFGWSYQKLTIQQARLFRRLGLHPGPDVSVHAAAAVAKQPVTQVRRLLDELAEVHLIEPVARDRYRFHDLLRAYAIDRADQGDPPEVRDDAIRALLDWYAYIAAAADRVLYPAYICRYQDLDKRPDALPAMNSRADAQTWFASERTNLITAIHYATQHGLAYWAMRLVHALVNYLYHYAHWDDLFDVCALGIVSAQHATDLVSEAWFLNRTAWARLQVSGWEHAVDDLQRSLAMAHDLHDPFLEAFARNDLGWGLLRQGRYVEALDYLRPALPLSQGTDGGRQEAFVRSNISRALAGLGHYHDALTHAERGLVLRRQAGDYEGEVFSLYQLAQLWQRFGDHHKAIALCEEALEIPREYVYLPDVAATLDTQGTSLQHIGDIERAEDCWLKALDVYDTFVDHRAPNLRTRLEALRANSQPAE